MTVWLWIAPVLGAGVGTFLYRCVERLPHEDRPFRGPWGRCDLCDGSPGGPGFLPIVGYLLGGGRCAACRGRLPLARPAVELLTAGGFWFLAWVEATGRLRYSAPMTEAAGWESMGVVIVSWCFFGALLVGSVVDLRHRILPDEVTRHAVIPAIVAAAAIPSVHLSLPLEVVADRHGAALAASLLGALVGGGAIYGIGVLGKVLFRREAMGFGDVKFMVFLGAVLGWQGVLIAFLLAALIASVVGLPHRIVTGSRYVPFGPFLAAGALLSFLAWRQMVEAYLEFAFPSGGMVLSVAHTITTI